MLKNNKFYAVRLVLNLQFKKIEKLIYLRKIFIINIFMNWWTEIIIQKRKEGLKNFTICPEFGPVPYMPAIPFTQQPIGNQWKINSGMKDLLKTHFENIN